VHLCVHVYWNVSLSECVFFYVNVLTSGYSRGSENVCVCMCEGVFGWVCGCESRGMCVCLLVCVHVCVTVYVYLYVFVCLYGSMRVCVCVLVHVSVYLCKSVNL
jgi:hypothetical protein